jgi:hypothetical protein
MHSTATNCVSVESGGDGVAAHVELHALGALADRVQLGASLSARIAPLGERLPLHDRGKVLVQMAPVLAGGGESCADIAHLHIQEELFPQYGASGCPVPYINDDCTVECL